MSQCAAKVIVVNQTSEGFNHVGPVTHPAPVDAAIDNFLRRHCALQAGREPRHQGAGIASTRLNSKVQRCEDGQGGYCRVWLARWRSTSTLRSAACLVTRPAIRLRHILNEEGFICSRISDTTADSFNPN